MLRVVLKWKEVFVDIEHAAHLMDKAERNVARSEIQTARARPRAAQHEFNPCKLKSPLYPQSIGA